MDRRRADASIAEVAARQYGVFSRAQAREAGLSDRQLRWRIAKGVIERLTLHTFLIAGCPTSWRQKLMTACLAAGPGAAASHRTAAALHEFDGFAPGVIEITVPQSRRDFRMDGVIVHSSSYWGDEDVTTVAGIPVSTPERTLCTLAAVCTDGQVESRATARSATAKSVGPPSPKFTATSVSAGSTVSPPSPESSTGEPSSRASRTACSNGAC